MLFPCQVLFRTREAATRAQLPALQAPGRVLLRLRNMPGAFRTISSIKADCIGRLVSVRGTVVRSTAPQPLVTSMEFVCGKCGAAQRVPFPDGRYTPPAGCAEHGCRSRTFMPVRPSAACIDWQRVVLQVGAGLAPAATRWLHSALCLCSCCTCWRCSPSACVHRFLCPPEQGLPKDERAAVGRVPVPIGVELTEDLVRWQACDMAVLLLAVVWVCYPWCCCQGSCPCWPGTSALCSSLLSCVQWPANFALPTRAGGRLRPRRRGHCGGHRQSAERRGRRR